MHFAPPLVITEDEIDRMVEIADESLTIAEREFAWRDHRLSRGALTPCPRPTMALSQRPAQRHPDAGIRPCAGRGKSVQGCWIRLPGVSGRSARRGRSDRKPAGRDSA